MANPPTPLIREVDPSIFLPVQKLPAVAQLAIVRPQNPPGGIAGFFFDIPDEENVEFSSDITDHFVENNTAVQDQIALRPEKVTVRGLVGELTNAQFTQGPLAPTPDTLPIFDPFFPVFTVTTVQTEETTQETIDGEVSSITSAQSLFVYYNNQSPLGATGTRQQKAFDYFRNLYRGRQLCSVETPWGTWENMAIETMRTTQTGASRFQTELSITFKQMRFAREISISASQLAGRASLQAAEKTQNGNAGKTPVPAEQESSVLYDMIYGP